jgi:SSS family transporter
MPTFSAIDPRTALGPLDWGICIGYLIVVFLLALWFSREQHTTEDFFVGGRRMHWLPIGLSLFAGTFSSLSFVGLPRAAAYEDYHLYLAILFIPLVVTPIVWCLFLPIYFRLNAISAYEYLERRFHRRLRLIASLLFMFFTVGWMGNLLRAVGVILQAVFDLSQTETVCTLVAIGLFSAVYTVLGGVKAVVWTDALQAVALGGGMLLVLFLAVDKIDGGWERMVDVAQSHDKFDMFHTTLDLKKSSVWGACAYGFFVYLAGHAVTFTSVQRYVSMPNIAAARAALIVNGVMVSVVCLVFFLVGSTLFVFYHQDKQAGSKPSALEASAKQADSPQSNLYDRLHDQKIEDQLVPRFIMKELPVAGLMGLLLAGLFAAAMSSVDSGINSMTASVVYDWQHGKQLQLRGSRLLCFVFGMAAVGTSVVLYFVGGNVFDMIMKIAGTFFGFLLAAFLLGMLIRRTNTEGVLIGMAAGVVGLAMAFGLEVTSYWFGAFTCVPTFVVGALASLFFPPPTEMQVRGLVVGCNGNDESSAACSSNPKS